MGVETKQATPGALRVELPTSFGWSSVRRWALKVYYVAKCIGLLPKEEQWGAKAEGQMGIITDSLIIFVSSLDTRHQFPIQTKI